MLKKMLLCPYCGKANDQHDDLKSMAVPKDGDIGLCIGCGGVTVFVVGKTEVIQRKVDQKELGEILASTPQLVRYLQAWKKLKEGENAGGEA